MNILREFKSLVIAAVSASHRSKSQRKSLQQLRFLFNFLGITAMAAGLYFGIDTRNFLDTAAKAEGTVVDLEYSGNSKKSGGYRPVVVFFTPKGDRIRFASSLSSDPPMYERGETVTVVYQTDNPSDARISDFFSIWSIPLILGTVGGMFFLAGTALGHLPKLKERRDEYLRKHGTPFKTEFLRVTLHRSTWINGIRPCQVFTQWKHPLTAETRVFRSDYLLFDPTPYIKTKDIMVFVDKDDSEKYLVDLSFIPDLEN